MTQRTLQLNPRGGVSLTPRPARLTAATPSVAGRREHAFPGVLRQVLAALGRFFVNPRGDLLWRADELPDAILKDVDPALYEARASRFTGWFGSDSRRMPPF